MHVDQILGHTKKKKEITAYVGYNSITLIAHDRFASTIWASCIHSHLIQV